MCYTRRFCVRTHRSLLRNYWGSRQFPNLGGAGEYDGLLLEIMSIECIDNDLKYLNFLKPKLNVKIITILIEMNHSRTTLGVFPVTL